MSKEALEKEVVANIRACLVSTKGQCDMRQISRDYRLLMGGEIPYSKIGYSSLEQFICSVPTLTTFRANGILYVDAKQTEKSAHISALVNSQKTRKRKSSLKPPRRSAALSRTKWQPRSVNKTFKDSPRPLAVKHNQFVNRSASPPRKTTISASLAARLGTRPPLVKTNSFPVENKENNLDDVFTKTRQRLTRKMERISIDQSNGVTSEDYDLENYNFNNNSSSFLASRVEVVEPRPAPPINVGRSFSWSDSLTTSKVNSEFITPSIPKQVVTTFVPTGDHLADLLSFVSLHNLGEPQIKVITRKSKPHKRPFFDCQIKVGTHSYTSYPDDFHTEVDAQQEAAKQALEELMPLYNRRRSFLVSDEKDVLTRIPPMVQRHFCGLWKEQLEADYTETYSEQLPINWLVIVDSLPNISVTPCLDKFVLRFCKPGEKGLENSMQFVSNISVPSNTTTFGDNGIIMAEITCPISASEIWCREINIDGANDFESMVTDFDQYCNTPSNLKSTDTVDVGGYYIAFAEEGQFWSRVRVFEVFDDAVNCFCIDFGDEFLANRTQIYCLPRQFARIQAQAFFCRLQGLEDLYEVSKSSEHIRNLCGRSVYVHLQDNNSADDQTPNVVLEDVEDESNINEQLRQHLESLFYKPPALKDTPTEVYLTHVEDSGLVYVKVPYFGSQELEIKLNDLETKALNDELNIPRKPITPENSKGKLYFVEDKLSHHWRRTKILDWSPTYYVQIQCIDYGNTDVINVNDTVMHLLEDYDDDLVKFAEQAQPAKFAIRNVPPNFGQLLRRTILADELVLVKVDGWDSDNLPLLKFFKRSGPDNLLYSINDTLASINEVSEMSVSSRVLSSNKLQKLMSLSQCTDAKLPSAGLLQAPSIPMHEYFDVYIPCAVSPYNFFIQPHHSKASLNKLMRELQERYKDVQYSPLSIQDIIPGNIYAAKYEDGQWYRTSVIKIINPGSISVYHCDFGLYTNLTLHQLLPLDETFLSLPYQAMKAKLAGIQPKHSKWSMDDCKYFESLVCNKQFVSVVMAMEKDAYYRSDTVLILKLVHTAGTVDIHIDQVLIHEGIAIAVE